MTPLRLLAAALFLTAPASAQDAKPAAPVTFDAHVKPILAKRCAKCHNSERPRGDLDLSTFDSLMQGGTSGKAAVAGKPDASPLFTLTAHLDEPKMPPGGGKIPQTEIDTIGKWIAGGLVEKTGGATAPVANPTATKPADGLGTATPLARRTPITALAVSPTATLAVVPGKKQVLVYELPAGKLLGGVAFPEGEIHALRFSADGKVLIAAGGIGGQSGAVVGFAVGSWKRLFAVTDESDAVLAADISADKTRIAFGGPNRLVKVASVPDGKLLHTFRKPTDWVLSVGFSPEGLLVAAGDRFGVVYLWETKSGKEFASLKGHTKAVTGLAWQADSNALATSSEDRAVRVWDLHSLAEAAKWDAHDDGVMDIAWHKDGALATAGRDGRIGVWTAKGEKTADLGPADDAVLKVAFAGDAKAVYSGDWSGAVRVWPTGGGAGTTLAFPVAAKPAETAAIPVPTPKLVSAAIASPASPQPAPPAPIATGDLARKRAALKAVEDAVEKLKDEAARTPGNPALAKAYLQLCEAALAMKAEVLAAESATGGK